MDPMVIAVLARGQLIGRCGPGAREAISHRKVVIVDGIGGICAEILTFSFLFFFGLSRGAFTGCALRHCPIIQSKIQKNLSLENISSHVSTKCFVSCRRPAIIDYILLPHHLSNLSNQQSSCDPAHDCRRDPKYH